MSDNHLTESANLSRREFFAAQALCGAMSNPAYYNHTPERLAEDAMRAADALIAALDKRACGTTT